MLCYVRTEDLKLIEPGVDGVIAGYCEDEIE